MKPLQSERQGRRVRTLRQETPSSTDFWLRFLADCGKEGKRGRTDLLRLAVIALAFNNCPPLNRAQNSPSRLAGAFFLLHTELSSASQRDHVVHFLVELR